jgi:hypothetical protein
MDTIVRQVEDWFASNCRLLSRSFPVLRFSLMQPSDEVRGKISIQVDGPVAGASMTFWNKGDVEVLVLDKVNKRDYPLDDRVLNPADDISGLLSSYCERVLALVKSTSSKSAP